MPVRRVALTGGIGSGKSYCLARFTAAGIPTIDADLVARQVVEPGTRALEAIARRFGASVLDAQGRLDRRALGAIVFADPDARQALEGIVHPRVYEVIDDWFLAATREGEPLAIADIPLLYETRREGEFDAVIVAACTPEQQLARVIARGLDDTEAARRIASQLPLADKARRADIVIDTSGTTDETDLQIEKLIRAFNHEAHEAHEGH